MLKVSPSVENHLAQGCRPHSLQRHFIDSQYRDSKLGLNYLGINFKNDSHNEGNILTDLLN